MKDRLADLADIVIDQKIDFHIARERPRSRSSIVKSLLSKAEKTVKDEL